MNVDILYNLLLVIFCILLPIEGRSVDDSHRNLPEKRHAEIKAQEAELKSRIGFHHNELMDVFYQNVRNCQKNSDGSEYYNSIYGLCSPCEEPQSIDPKQYQLCSNFRLKQELKTIIKENINCLMRDDIPRYYDDETKTCQSCEKCKHGDCKIICTLRQEKEYVQLTEDESKSVAEILPWINFALIVIGFLISISIYLCKRKGPKSTDQNPVHGNHTVQDNKDNSVTLQRLMSSRTDLDRIHSK